MEEDSDATSVGWAVITGSDGAARPRALPVDPGPDFMMATKTLSCWRVPATDTVGSSTEDGAETDTVVEAEVDVVEQDEAPRPGPGRRARPRRGRRHLPGPDHPHRPRGPPAGRHRYPHPQQPARPGSTACWPSRPPTTSRRAARRSPSLVVHRAQRHRRRALRRGAAPDRPGRRSSDEVKRERHAAEARMECYRWAGRQPARPTAATPRSRRATTWC